MSIKNLETIGLVAGATLTAIACWAQGLNWTSITMAAVLISYCLTQFVRSFKTSKFGVKISLSSDTFYLAKLDGTLGDTRGHALPRGSQALSSPPVPRAASVADVLHVPSKSTQPARWVGPEETVEVAGYRIPGGMFYLGTGLKDAFKDPDPSLVDPRKPVLAHPPVDIARISDYWPSYSRLTPAARAGYLNWLASGRKSSGIDPAYVNMFFYGIERHVLMDGVKVHGSRSDWPAIKTELLRLKTLYGKIPQTVSANISELLQYMQLCDVPSKGYLQPLPPLDLINSSDIPFYLRVVLGQACRDKYPISSALAFAWQAYHPGVMHRTAVKRCPVEFEALFPVHYYELYQKGFVIAPSGLPLVYAYRPVSTAFERGDTFELRMAVPDVANRLEYGHRLQFVVDLCDEALKPFSRAMAKEPSKKLTLDALIRLPPALWPDTAQEILENIQDRVKDRPQMLVVQDLLSDLESTLVRENDETARQDTAELTKDVWQGLTRALEAYHVRNAGPVISAIPKRADVIVIYRKAHEDISEVTFQADSVLQEQLVLETLATFKLVTDASSASSCAFDQIVDSWRNLTPAAKLFLQVHGRQAALASTTVTALRKRIQKLPKASRKEFAALLCAAISLGGAPRPMDVTALELVYKWLDLDSNLVYSQLHEAATARVEPERLSDAASASKPIHALNRDLIAKLQADSEEASVFLAKIFTGEDADEEQGPDVQETVFQLRQVAEGEVCLSVSAADNQTTPSATYAQPTLLGALGPSVAALATHIAREKSVSLASWGALCKASKQLPDGALELINDICLDIYGIPFTVGYDPIEFNDELSNEFPEISFD